MCRPRQVQTSRALTLAGFLALAAGCGQRIESAFELCDPRRAEADFVLPVRVTVAEGPKAETVYEIEARPKLLVVGQERVELGVRLVRRGSHVVFDELTDSFHLRSRGGERPALRANASGVLRPVAGSIRVRGAELTGTIESVKEDMVGYWDLVLERADGEVPPVPFAVRVVRRVRIALTFDDGPSTRWNTTKRILDALEEEGIKAAFFVLTTPDRTFGGRRRKADSPGGFDLLVREVKEGHLIGCHWGGRYGSQHNTHPRRIPRGAYDADSDGRDDVVGPDGCALESDLLECMTRVECALAAAGRPLGPEFVRPPLWRYRAGIENALPTYEDLGLKMILTDAWVRDGGYGHIPFCRPKGYLVTRNIEGAIREGHGEIVVTMHDSNFRTARRFKSVLADIRRKMAGLGLEEGSEWCFISDTEELRGVLRKKRRFRSDVGALMPDISGGGAAPGQSTLSPGGR